MLKTCKYCTSQEVVCDACGESAILSGLSETLPSGELANAAFTLCVNMECSLYGKYIPETAEHVELITCVNCLLERTNRTT